MLSTIRSLLFALYQLLVTPPYALLVLACFWMPPKPRYRVVIGWCWLILQGARLICGIRWRVIGRASCRERV